MGSASPACVYSRGKAFMRKKGQGFHEEKGGRTFMRRKGKDFHEEKGEGLATCTPPPLCPSLLQCSSPCKVTNAVSGLLLRLACELRPEVADEGVHDEQLEGLLSHEGSH